MIETFNHWGESALRFAWPMLWQSSLLIAVLFTLDFVLRRKVRAAVRYALWLVVLIKLLLPPSFAFPTSVAWWLRPSLPPPPVIEAKEFVVTYSPALIPATSNLSAFHAPLPPPVPRLSAAACALMSAIGISLGLFAWMLWRWGLVIRRIRGTETPPDSLRLVPAIRVAARVPRRAAPVGPIAHSSVARAGPFAPGRCVGELRPDVDPDRILVASAAVAGQFPHPPPARRGR